jgi:co-chaperonin GroES (HSP10)
VLVRIIRSPDRLESGLFLPEGAKDDAAQALMGEVLEVARTMPKTSFYDEDEWDPDEDYDLGDEPLGENVSGIPIEAKVLFEKKHGVAVPWDESLRLLEVRHVLAIVEEIPEDEIQ